MGGEVGQGGRQGGGGGVQQRSAAPTALGPKSRGREDNRGRTSSLQVGQEQEKAPQPLWVWKEDEAILQAQQTL